jgi:hypothetical protein
LESLEARVVLASGVVSSGNLMITSNTAADLLVEQTAANEWTVSDGGVEITGSPFAGVTKNVSIRTFNSDDTIQVDLGGFTAPRSLIIQAGAGENNISIANGTVAGVLDVRSGSENDIWSISNLTVNSLSQISLGHGDNTLEISASTFKNRVNILTGNGTDGITLGDGVDPVAFNNSLYVLDAGGADDTLLVNDEVTVKRVLVTDNVNEVTIEAGAEVQGSMLFDGGFEVDNSLTLHGVVDGNLSFYGNFADDELTLSASSVVGGAVTAYMRAGNDTATFAGTIGRTLLIDGQGGDDTIHLGGLVTQRATIYGGNGADAINFTGTIGVAPSTSGRLTIDAGAGDDEVAIRAASRVNGQLSVNMNSGNDGFALHDAALLTSGLINGGTGTDSYFGTRPRANVVDKLFEIFGLVSPF